MHHGLLYKMYYCVKVLEKENIGGSLRDLLVQKELVDLTPKA